MFSVSKRKINLCTYLLTFLLGWWTCSNYYANKFASKFSRELKNNVQRLNMYSPKTAASRIGLDGNVSSAVTNFPQGNRELIRSDSQEFTMPYNDVIQHLSHNITWDSNMTIRKFYAWDPQVLQNSYLSEYKSPCFYSPKKYLFFLPYFFLAGMPKSGTTDVWSKLTQHPRILNSIKEPHWWSRLWTGKGGGKRRHGHFNSYTRLLKVFVKRYDRSGKNLKDVVVGDGSASTFWDNNYWFTSGVDNTPGLLQIIHSVLPKAKFIVVFREPAERLFSSYRYFKVGKVQNYHRQVVRSLNSFSACFNRSSVRTCTFNQSINTKKLRVYTNMYSVYVREFLRFFPRDQLFHFRLDEWSKDCPGVLQKIFVFLEIVTNEELTKIAYDCLNPAKSVSYDGLRPAVVRNVMPFISESLLHFFNTSLMQGIFPDKLKQARNQTWRAGGGGKPNSGGLVHFDDLGFQFSLHIIQLMVDALTHQEVRRICQRDRKNTAGGKKHTTLHQSSKTRELVRQFYKPYLRELSELLQDSRYLWEDDV